MSKTFAFWFAACAFACSPPPMADAGHVDANDVARDAHDVIEAGPDISDVPPPPYDAGPLPTCSVTPFVRHLIDRPGGGRVAAPAGLVRTATGFLTAYRRTDYASADGGVDGGGGPVTVDDRIEALRIADDGTAGTPQLVFDGTSQGDDVRGPVILPAGAGAITFFEASRGLPSDATFDEHLETSVLDAMGVPATPNAIRSRYPVPSMDTLTNGNLLGISFALGPASDSGIVSVHPVSLSLAPDGSDLRPNDVDLNTVVPFDIAESVMRASDNGGAFFAYREGAGFGFVRFQASGALGGRGSYHVSEATLSRLDDAAAVSDAVIGVWADSAASQTAVHAVVASVDGMFRAQFDLDNFMGEGPTIASAVPAYGGVAVLWRRGVDANARIRIAIVSPDGTLRVPATDLIMTPHLEGRVVPWVSGREIAFIAQEGLPPAWGYLFGRACLPGM